MLEETKKWYKGMNILEETKKWQETLTQIRRFLHQNPEESMKEYDTAAYIRDYLTQKGIPWIEAGPTGTVAVVRGTREKPVIGLRGDIDALEMDELNDVPYRSVRPGVMHACGHDGHTASLLCAAVWLYEHRAEIPAVVKLIFQPGEENGQGAESVVNSGAVSDVEGILGLHVASSIPTGKADIRAGAMSAANDKFRIWITGKGCHGSAPQNGADALLAGTSLVNMLQSVITRESDPKKPSVMTIGIFRSGTAFNILPENAYIEGSIRVLEEEQREVNRQAVRRMAKAAADAYRCQVRTEFECTAKVVYNDETLTGYAITAAKEILGDENVSEQPLSLGAEDFGAFLSVCPVTYINIGSGNEDKGSTYPHHHGMFDIDEDCLPICMAMYIRFVMEMMAAYKEKETGV